MADVKELFPDCETESGWYHPGYSAIVASFGDVDLKVSDHDYQGSTYAVIRRLGKVGYLEFGWGSCSGCDALEACESYEDLQRLCDRLESGIQWFEGDDELKAWATSHDWQGSFCWQDGVRDFLRAFNAKFSTDIALPEES